MKKLRCTIGLILLTVAACACSFEISQVPADVTPTLDVQAIRTAAVETIMASIATPTGAAPAHPGAIGNPALPSTTIPVSWGALNLTGKLIYIVAGQDANTGWMRIQALKLDSGEIVTIYQAQDAAWIYFVTVSPDGSQLVMAYSPPPGSPLGGHQALYVMPTDGSAGPQLLFSPPTGDDEYFQPTWSSDGKYIYFTHVNFQLPPKVAGQHYPIYEVMRMAYPGGQPEKIADQAFWPRLSNDSSHLVFVSLDPITGKNKLLVADPDGGNAQEVPLSGAFVPDYIDAPIFSPDNASLMFSAVDQVQSSVPTWLERALGITVASAHMVPSDWFSVPVGGGTPTQLTHIMSVGLFASISPDQRYIASYSGYGIFAMNLDGSGSTILINDVGGIPGTVSWIP